MTGDKNPLVQPFKTEYFRDLELIHVITQPLSHRLEVTQSLCEVCLTKAKEPSLPYNLPIAGGENG